MKTKKTEGSSIVVSAVAVVLALAAIGVGYLVTEGAPSGEAVASACRSSSDTLCVKYYGVSNYPLARQKDKIQTFVTLRQPTLGRLGQSSTVINVAGEIISAVDRANGIVGLYQGSPPVPIPTGGLDAAIAGAGIAVDYFKKNTECLGKIGEKYGSNREFSFVMVTQMAYKECSYPYNDWMVAYVQHNFYTYPDGKWFCRQDSTKLFSIEEGTGKTSKSTFGC